MGNDDGTFINFFLLDHDEQKNRLEEVSALAEMLMNQDDTCHFEYTPGTLNRLGCMIWQRLH